MSPPPAALSAPGMWPRSAHPAGTAVAQRRSAGPGPMPRTGAASAAL